MTNSPSSPQSLTALSAIELSRAIHERSVSCHEVMSAYLAQIEQYNAQVNALVSLRAPEDLLAQARLRDDELARGASRGWMHGMPHAPKDYVAVAGMRTTQGSPLFADQITETDGIIVERMRRSGAIFIGRTNVPEFALGSHSYNPVFGTTRNAFDTDLSAGGSSGGAAAALALNMLPCADGSDMMGSLRNPAAFNHVVGFRPTWGMVPAGPALDVFYSQLSTEGPMARSVADAARLLAVMAGYDERAPLSIDFDRTPLTQSLATSVRGRRVGWLGDLSGYLPFEEGVLDICRAALGYLVCAGCVVEDATLDFDMDRVWRSWLTLRSFLVCGRLKPYYDDPARRPRIKPEAIWEVEQGLSLPAQAVYGATQERTAWALALRELFATFDVLVLPSAQVFPFDAQLTWPRTVGDRTMDTYHRWMEVVVPASLAGLPAIGVPCGVDARGRPMGIQLIGPARSDLALLQLAHAYEQASGFGSQHSPLLPGCTRN
jgi:amidase